MPFTPLDPTALGAGEARSVAKRKLVNGRPPAERLALAVDTAPVLGGFVVTASTGCEAGLIELPTATLPPTAGFVGCEANLAMKSLTGLTVGVTGAPTDRSCVCMAARTRESRIAAADAASASTGDRGAAAVCNNMAGSRKGNACGGA